jgi:hypothetical protein
MNRLQAGFRGGFGDKGKFGLTTFFVIGSGAQYGLETSFRDLGHVFGPDLAGGGESGIDRTEG